MVSDTDIKSIKITEDADGLGIELEVSEDLKELLFRYSMSQATYDPEFCSKVKPRLCPEAQKDAFIEAYVIDILQKSVDEKHQQLLEQSRKEINVFRIILTGLGLWLIISIVVKLLF